MRFLNINPALLVIILALYYNQAVYGQEPVVINYDKQAYVEFAKQWFYEGTGKSKFSFLRHNKSDSTNMIFISIPILQWKKGLYYGCGDNIEPLIDFSQDVRFQEVKLLRNYDNGTMKKFGEFSIHDSYFEKTRYEDSINGDMYWLPREPFLPGYTSDFEKNIAHYCYDHPDVFVFKLYGMDGYWAVIDGELRELSYKKGKIIDVNANQAVVDHYGDVYVNHMMDGGFRTGFPYKPCTKVKVNDPIPVVVNFK